MLTYLFSILTQLFHFVLGLNTPQSFPPPLPAEKEREYFCLAAKGDDSAREKLIIHNLRLVSHIVRKYYASNPNQEDLISIGTIGLVKAVDSFNAENGARFATYAAKCIQNTILSQRLFYHQTLQKKRLLTEDGTLLIVLKDIGAY